MALDVTEDFRAIARERRGFTTKEELLKPIKKASQFSTTAKELSRSISLFQQRLRDYRPAYLAINRNLQGGDFMTDRERDELDETSQLFYQNTKEAIAELEASIGDVRGKGREREEDHFAHKKGLVEFLNIKLSKMRLFHKELRTLRLKNNFEKKEMTLHTSIKAQKSQIHPEIEQRYGNTSSPTLPSPSSSSSSLVPESSSETEGEPNDDGFSPAERQLFAQEGEALMRELNAMVDEVRAAEKKVLEIASMQTVIESHLLHQATQIEHLYDESVETTETIKRGNQTLTEAKKKYVWVKKNDLDLPPDGLPDAPLP